MTYIVLHALSAPRYLIVITHRYVKSTHKFDLIAPLSHLLIYSSSEMEQFLICLSNVT